MATDSTRTPSTAAPNFQQPLTIGQVYGDERHSRTHNGKTTYSEQFHVVYEDADRVLLRHTTEKDYRYEQRDSFENGIGNRWVLLEEADNSDDPVAAIPDIAPLVSMLKHRVEAFNRGRTESASLKAEGVEEAIRLIEAHEPSPVHWEEINGIGEKTAENLTDAGFTTDSDIHAATDEQIIEVPGMGEKNLANLRAHISDSD